MSETVACNEIREDTNLFSLFENYAVLLDDDVEFDSVSYWALPNGEVDISFSDDDVREGNEFLLHLPHCCLAVDLEGFLSAIESL